MLKQNFLRSLWLWMLFIVVGNVGAQNVAKIGTTEYATLQEAVATVTDGTATTITMLADVDLAAALTVANTKNITLDLNGKTVKNDANKTLSQIITVKGTLTIDDSSAEKSGVVKNTASGKYVFNINANTGVLTLNNGTIETTTGNSNGAVYGSYGLFAMTGGKIIAAGTGVGVKNVNISGGVIAATAGPAISAGGTISGGTITSTGKYSVYASSGDVLNITGGTFAGKAGEPTIRINNTDVKVSEGVVLPNGIDFVSNAKAMLLAGTSASSIANTDIAIYDGETVLGYATVKSDIFKSTKVADKTVKLTKNIATTTYIGASQKFTLDLNGYNIVCTPTKSDAAFAIAGTSISSLANVTIKGEGKISCADHGEGCNAIQVAKFATLNIEGGEFSVPGDNTTIYALATSQSFVTTINISGGKFESGDGKYVLNIKDDVRAYNTFNVTGGTFHGFNPADNIAEGEHTNFVAAGYCTTSAEGKFTITVCDHKAVINAVHYATLADAVAAVPTDGTATTIKMLADAELSAAVTVALGQNIVLDLNGKTITSTTTAISNKGNLEVTGTGNITVTGTSNTAYGISNVGGAALTNRAHLVVGENVTITAPCSAVYTSYAYTTINGTLANTQAETSRNIYSTLRQSNGSEVIVSATAKVTGQVNAIYGNYGTVEVNSTNVGKIYADGSATQGLKIKKTTAIESLNVVGHAEFSDVEDYYVAAKALSACTGTVKLLSDINGALALSAGKTVTLDLNGHKVDAETYPIKVEGNLTITGEGTVQSTGMGSSTSVQAATYVLKNGKLTILSGNYVAGFEGAEGNPAVYVRDNAVVEIKGGDFEGGSKFLLNKLDSSRETSKIEVTGGTFHNNFNPADNAAEGEHTNFVAEGYESVDNGDGTWTVRQKPVSVDVPEANEEGVVVIEKEKDAPEATVEEKAAATTAVTEVLAEISNNTTTTADDATNVETAGGVTTLAITVANVTVETTPAGEGTNATATVTKVTYDVQPKDEEGKDVNVTAQPITFRLPVPQSFNGSSVKVSHKHGETTTSTYETVRGGGANKFVALSSDKFSEWTLEDVNPSTVAVIGESQYNSLAEAIAAVPTNGTETTILMLANTVENVTVPAGANITLDLGNHTLNGGSVATNGNKAAIVNKGTIVINGNEGTIKREDDDTGLTASNSYYVIDNQGTMTINTGVTVTNNSGVNEGHKGSSLIRNGETTANASLTIDGATLVQPNFNVIKDGGNGSNLVIKSGTIGTSGQLNYAVLSYGAITVEDGTVNGPLCFRSYDNDACEATIKGGTINGNMTVETYPGNTPAKLSSLEIIGGTINGTLATGIGNGTTFTTDTEAKANGNIAVSGGNFSSVIPEEYCALGFVPVTEKNEQGLYEVKELDLTLRVYTGSDSYTDMKIAAFVAHQEENPNAMALVSSDCAQYVAGATNVIVDYTVGHGHYYECEKFVLTDRNWYSPVKHFIAVSGSYSRTIFDGLNAICVPFDVEENALFTKHVFHSANVDGNTAYFNSCNTTVSAGEAFLAQVSGDKTWTFGFNHTDIFANPMEGSGFRGTYGDTYVSDCYKINDAGTGLQYHSSAINYAFRGYLDLSNDFYLQGSQQPNNLRIAFDEIEDDTTGISAIGNGANVDVIYNVQGLRLSKQQKGINILNGKKVLK